MQKILNILSEVFDTDITEDKLEFTPEDIENWDSITHMELMSILEETYDIELDVEDIMEMDSIQKIIDKLDM